MSIASLCLVSVRMSAEGEGAVHDMQAGLFDSVLRHQEVKSRALLTLGKQQVLHPRAMLSAQNVRLQAKPCLPETSGDSGHSSLPSEFHSLFFLHVPSCSHQGTAQQRGPYLELSLALSKTAGSGSQASHNLSPHIPSHDYPLHGG